MMEVVGIRSVVKVEMTSMKVMAYAEEDKSSTDTEQEQFMFVDRQDQQYVAHSMKHVVVFEERKQETRTQLEEAVEKKEEESGKDVQGD